jgi:hypothetical protein
MAAMFSSTKLDSKHKLQTHVVCENVSKNQFSTQFETMRYNRYVTVFAYQDARLPRPFYSHVFATWASEKDDKITDGFTISWYGEKNVPGPQNGINLSLSETYNRAVKQGLTVYRFGPYYCTEDFYQKAKKLHVDLVNKDYNVLDKFTKHDGAFNCIHAVGYASGEAVETKMLFGKEAANKLVHTFIGRNLMTAKIEENVWPKLKKYFLMPKS